MGGKEVSVCNGFIAVTEKHLSSKGRNFRSRSIKRGSITKTYHWAELKDKHYFEAPGSIFTVTIGTQVVRDSDGAVYIQLKNSVFKEFPWDLSASDIFLIYKWKTAPIRFETRTDYEKRLVMPFHIIFAPFIIKYDWAAATFLTLQKHFHWLSSLSAALGCSRAWLQTQWLKVNGCWQMT